MTDLESAVSEILDGFEVPEVPHRPAATYKATTLSDVQPERVSWLWPGRLPFGKVVTCDGDPSVGKSTLVIDLAARLTTGRPMPSETEAWVPPSDVVLMSAEDGLSDTVRPRLDAAGADTTRVHHFDGVQCYDDNGQPTGIVPPAIPGDLPALEQLINDTGAKFVVVDVLMAYLHGQVNSHKDQDVRRALSQLAAVAERTGACIVLLRHLTKGSAGSSALYRGGGSIGVIGLARVGLTAGHDPADDTGERRILAVAKCNVAEKAGSVAYTLVSDPDRGCARIEWLGGSALSADELVAPNQSAEERSAVDEAAEWLQSVLTDGPQQAAVLRNLAQNEGISWASLKRAKDKLGVEHKRDENAKGRPSSWSLAITAQPPVSRNARAVIDTPSEQGEQPETGHYGSTREPEPKPPAAGIGRCARCHASTRVYGPAGNPLCDSCRTPKKESDR